MIHNIAHLGASAYEPENTLRVFERAIEMGATMLELDVHLSQDGHPVIIHDADLSRIANGNGRIRDMGLKQIKSFDAGQGERVPTLSEAIELARGRAELYIELKRTTHAGASSKSAPDIALGGPGHRKEIYDLIT